jgi:hypothetical protein
MVQRPLPHSVKISAYMLRVQLRPGLWIPLHHVKCKDPNVCVALKVQSEYFYAMIWW